MDTVTIRDLRNHGGDVLNRVAHGESLLVTRDGAHGAELRPLQRGAISSAELTARRTSLPALDVEQFTTDVDSVLDTTVGTYDALIAATAIANALPLDTCNPADFAGIDELDVVAVPHPAGR